MAFTSEMHSPFGHIMYYVHMLRDRHEKSIVTIRDRDQHTTTNTQPDFGSVLIKDKTKFEGSKMCHNWFWIDYFRLNWHLIIEILAHICRSEVIIARPLCWEITRNNMVNYFKFSPVFEKDCLHFRKERATTLTCPNMYIPNFGTSCAVNFLEFSDQNRSKSIRLKKINLIGNRL